jgi:predicted RNase H-like HicB family nuclease
MKLYSQTSGNNETGLRYMVRYTILLERGERNYPAYCPDLRGVIATGTTKKETIARMQDAIVFHLEGLCKMSHEIPPPTDKPVMLNYIIS